MRRLFLISLSMTLAMTDAVAAPAAGAPAVEAPRACVALLHGLARGNRSMEKMAAYFSARGYHVLNLEYPSREKTVGELAAETIPRAVAGCERADAAPIHFVTHSLGGILLRYYLRDNDIARLGRVVMLSPPNQGSEVVDKLSAFPGFRLINGPAGYELGTGVNSVPLRLGAADYELGIITGNRSINLVLSLLIPGDDDGKVSVARARLDGARDFLVLPYAHPFIMKRKAVMRQAEHFLLHGGFHRGD